jgi:U32 family peptidase
MKKCELLAPAGSIESLYAAVLSGANAVYLGGNRFSARAYASNFDNETLNKVVDYCHMYGVKVYITLNTLIKESEIEDAVDYIKFLFEIGVDALIIQDTGIAYIMNKVFPDFEIHASTQMTIHNAEGAEFLVNSGFQRIVLSRELSVEEIEHISSYKGIETEIFVHGALCICYSGQCLMSSMIGGRSGNRGRCAQPCRLPYRIINRGTGEERQGYLLSPKDMCTVESLEDIVKCGTSSLKIEGRMKRPEYVAGVVRSYRRSLDFIYGIRSSFNAQEEQSKLLKLFNREGFSKAYLHGNIGSDMMAYNYPKNTGVFIGKVLKDLSIVLQEDIYFEDGIRSGDEGFVLSKIIKNGKEVTEAYKDDCVKIYPSNFKSGDLLYKTSDIKLMRELGQIYNNPYSKKIELDLSVTFAVNSRIVLQAEFNGKRYRVEGDEVQKAVNRPIDKGRIEENLRKTGDSSFLIRSIDYLVFDEGFLPISSINFVRRELLDSIFRAETEKYKRTYAQDEKKLLQINTASSSNNKLKETSRNKEPEYLICVNTFEQIRAVEELEFDNIVIDLYKRGMEFDIKKINCKNIYLRIPNIIKREFAAICSIIDKNLPHISGLVTANLGIINRFKERTKIIGDYKLNVFNSFSVRFFNEYLYKIPLSLELNKKEVHGLLKGLSSENIEVGRLQQLIYGKVELMVTEYCPIGSTMGGKNAKCNCNNACEKGSYILKDRKDEEFAVINDKFCRSYIYNSVAVNLMPMIEEFMDRNIVSFRLDFVDEDHAQTYKVLKALLDKDFGSLEGNYTRGHYKRGVE